MHHGSESAPPDVTWLLHHYWHWEGPGLGYTNYPRSKAKISQTQIQCTEPYCHPRVNNMYNEYVYVYWHYTQHTESYKTGWNTIRHTVGEVIYHTNTATRVGLTCTLTKPPADLACHNKLFELRARKMTVTSHDVLKGSVEYVEWTLVTVWLHQLIFYALGNKSSVLHSDSIAAFLTISF